MSVYVMHAYKEDITMQLDVHTWFAPALEAVEIPEGDFYAQKLVEHYGSVYGLIAVESVKTRNGTSIDLAEAEKRAKVALKTTEDALLAMYVRRQQEGRLRQNLPCIAPTGRVDEIVRSRNIDLGRMFNIYPVGYDFTPSGSAPHTPSPSTPQPSAPSPELEELRAANEVLRAESAAKDEIINTRLAALEQVIL